VRSGALLAADIGGTRARLLAADANGGIFARHTMASREFDVSRLTSELALLAGDVKPQAVCVGVAGVVSGYEWVVTVAPNLPSIEAVALKPFLEERLDAPVAVENDVNLAAMGEHTSGAGEGASPRALISLGTGLGAGIIIGGSLFRGAHDGAGEIGLLSSVGDIFRQPSSVGPLESRISGAALEQHGDPCEIFEQARAGESAAREIVDSVADGLGLAVANLFALLEPELVVLGGWIPKEQDLLVERIQRVASRLAPGSTPIAVAKLDDNAALLGALSIAYQVANTSFLESSGRSSSPAAASSPSDAQP